MVWDYQGIKQKVMEDIRYSLEFSAKPRSRGNINGRDILDYYLAAVSMEPAQRGIGYEHAEEDLVKAGFDKDDLLSCLKRLSETSNTIRSLASGIKRILDGKSLSKSHEFLKIGQLMEEAAGSRGNLVNIDLAVSSAYSNLSPEGVAIINALSNRQGNSQGE